MNRIKGVRSRERVSELEKMEMEYISGLYKRIACREITREQAAQIAGYKRFKYLDSRRKQLGLDRVHPMPDVDAEQIRESYARIARLLYNGTDIREQEAHKLGFENFKSMDRKRIKLELGSIRDYIFKDHPEKYERYLKKIGYPSYQRSLEKKRKKG